MDDNEYKMIMSRLHGLSLTLYQLFTANWDHETHPMRRGKYLNGDGSAITNTGPGDYVHSIGLSMKPGQDKYKTIE